MSLLSGCGFYLRTTTLGSYLSTVNLDVAKSPLLERELERAFLLNDVSVSDSESADLSIRLKDSEFQKIYFIGGTKRRTARVRTDPSSHVHDLVRRGRKYSRRRIAYQSRTCARTSGTTT